MPAVAAPRPSLWPWIPLGKNRLPHNPFGLRPANPSEKWLTGYYVHVWKSGAGSRPRIGKAPRKSRSRRRWSLFRHTGLAQPGEIGGFEPGAAFWRPRTHSGQSGDARIAIVAAQLSGFGELGSRAFSLAFEGIGGSEPGANVRLYRVGTTRFFEPKNRVVGASLHEIRPPDRLIPKAQVGITGAEPDGLLYERDRLFYRSR